MCDRLAHGTTISSIPNRPNQSNHRLIQSNPTPVITIIVCTGVPVHGQEPLLLEGLLGVREVSSCFRVDHVFSLFCVCVCVYVAVDDVG